MAVNQVKSEINSINKVTKIDFQIEYNLENSQKSLKLIVIYLLE